MEPMTDELGRRMHSQNIVLRGRLGDHQWRVFLLDCAAAMGMTPAGAAAAYHYPMDGKGGTGLTLCQPITESFLVIDTWPDHDGAYLHISSCKKFSVVDLVETIRLFGLGMDFGGRKETLSLDPVPPVNHLDDYPEVPAHSGAPSDPRFDPVEG